MSRPNDHATGRSQTIRRIAAGATIAVIGGGLLLTLDPFGVTSAQDGGTSDQVEADAADGNSGDDNSNDGAEPTATTPVMIETLVSSQETNGDLGFGVARELSTRRGGTITWLPEIGDEIAPGDILWEIDQQAIYYIPGDVPMYRDLYKGVKKGDDILQLEQYLASAGYGPENWEPDTSFNSTTRSAVKLFEKDAGMTQDGVIRMSDIVVGTDILRVEKTAHKGDAADAVAALQVTDAEAKVTLTTSSRQLEIYQNTPNVNIELADGVALPAQLDKVKATPADEQGNFGYELTYVVEGSVDEAQPVKVALERTLVADALTVPVDALIALAEGGYAVQVKVDDSLVLRGVEVIDFDDARVAISGDLAEGDLVAVPS